jgi:hypothetical protein
MAYLGVVRPQALERRVSAATDAGGRYHPA